MGRAWRGSQEVDGGREVSAEVIPFPESKVSLALGRAASAELETIIIMGFDKDGVFWSDCVAEDGADVLWLLEEAKRKTLEAGR